MLMNRLKEFRDLHGLTQEELAERSGVTRQLIGRLETEPGLLVSMSTAVRLCRYFHADIGRLFWIDWTSAVQTTSILEEVPA